MEIKIHTVGKIVRGNKYEGWYIFIQTFRKHGHFLLLLSDDETFGKDENGKLVEGERYDTWMPNMPSLENFFTLHEWEIEWLEWKPSWLPNWTGDE